MFRKKRAEKQLSAEEFKTQLYSHFDKTGLLNRMRTEIRGNIATELLKVTTPVKASETDEVFVDFEEALLPLQVTNWLVYDHLLRQGHQYALSVFSAEANLAQPQQQLTVGDILCLFGLDSTTSEYQSISKMYSTGHEHGRSYSLLLAVAKSLFDFSHRGERHTSSELFDKELPHKLSPKHIPEKEQHGNASADPESLKFRNRNMSREDLFCGVNNTADSNLSEQLQSAMEESRRENQNMRQKLVQELDRLHAQERSQQLEMEQERLQIKKEKDALLAEKERLKEKDLLLTQEYENKLERKIRELETDFTSKMYKKEKSVEELQRKLFEKEQRITQVEVDFSSQKTGFHILKKELEDTQKMHKTIHQKYSALLNDNTNLLKKFESMSDYAVLKDELEAKSQQMSNLQRDIGDISKISEREKGALTEIVRNLEIKLNAKDSELMETQRQLNLTRDTLHMKENVWCKEKRKLEQENLASKDMYRIFSQKLEEQKEDIQALHQTIHLLHYQLTEKNSRGSSTPEPLSRQKTAFTIRERTTNDPDVFRISRNFKESPTKYKESSLKFIEDAKNKISKLQQQEDELQDKCSFVYSSVPEFNNRFLTNHLAYNASCTHPNAIVTEPINRFSRNLNDSFKNLIGNEMPILDASFPANSKNSRARTFTDVYTPQVSRTPEVASNADSTLNASTSKVYNSSLKNTITSTGALEHASHLKTPDYVVDKSNYNTQDMHKLVPQISNDPLVSNETEYSNTRGVILKNLISDNSIITSQTQVKTLNKLPFDISSLEKESTLTSKIFSPVQKEIYQSDIHQRDVPRESRPLSKDVENINTSNSERLNPDLNKQPSKDLAINFEDDLPSSNVGKSVSKFTEESVCKILKDADSKDASHSESVVDVPIVVDLDAAWKRKSSLLPVDSSSQPESLIKQKTLEQVTEHKTIPNTAFGDLSENKVTLPNINTKEPIHFSEDDSKKLSDGHDVGLRRESSDQSKIQEESSTQSMIQKKSSDQSVIQKESSAQSMIQKESSDQSVIQKESSDQSVIQKESSDQSVIQKESSKQGPVEPSVSHNLKQEIPKHDLDVLTSKLVYKPSSQPVDAGSIGNVVSEDKNVHEDSLSELSEIHLSCGSEQEQQKEDSDNW